LGPDPFKTTLSDRTLQELVDKVLLPNLCAQDTAQEREFYSSRGINLKPEHEEDFLNKEFPKDNEARVFGFAKNLQVGRSYVAMSKNRAQFNLSRRHSRSRFVHIRRMNTWNSL
jgi:hypothetical protein